ncbi:hypothetical protein HNQ44_001345 [Planomicrobium koreense]|uniref:Uncharacterized protein n=1 Tax=Planococcus koreensis TaxID=112331 RepID=A0A7W8FTC9_9BACL|nr:UPF0158 family protein [Planococcus koreensis]MBB5179921.1 hypothetical protein [Planococcus koreensis]
MAVIDELADLFLYHSDDMQGVLNRITGEILFDGEEDFTGEPEIDWDVESAEHLLLIPQLTSPEAFDMMLLFAKAQKPANQTLLIEILGERKPFRHFKDTVQALNIEQSWYKFEQAYAKERISEWLKKNEIELDLL